MIAHRSLIKQLILLVALITMRSNPTLAAKMMAHPVSRPPTPWHTSKQSKLLNIVMEIQKLTSIRLAIKTTTFDAIHIRGLMVVGTLTGASSQ